jgi:hypothetical protein
MPFVVVEPGGSRRWSASMDADGHREYRCTVRVVWQDVAGTGPEYAGPAAALQAVGLPAVGSPWAFTDDAPDPFAYRRLPTTANPVIDDGEPTTAFDVELTFSTKPDPGRCRTEQQDDPLSVPPQVSLTFAAFNEEATHDRFGQPVAYSSHEQIRGTLAEFERRRVVIKITMNKGDGEFSPALLDAMQDTLNDTPVFGFARRRLKLTGSADRQYYGDCLRYWKVSLELESNGPRGWDRDARDQGRRVLSGHWHAKAPVWVLDPLPGCGGVKVPPNHWNPAHFVVAKDRHGDPSVLVLNGEGRPYQPDDFSFTFHGTAAEAKAEADSVRAAYLGPYATEAEANAACCVAGDATGTGPRFPGEGPRQVYVYFGGEPSVIAGDPVEDWHNWVVLTSPVTGEGQWNAATFYTRGTVVGISGVPVNYVAVADSVGVYPAPLEEGAVVTDWAFLPTGLHDAGVWDLDTIYAVGDYVVLPVPGGAPSAATGTGGGQWWCITGVGDLAPGVVHVEYYRESHFQDLGMPPTL